MADTQPVECDGEPVDTTNLGLRIASIFIILAAALLGALLPVFLAKSKRDLHRTFFVCKFIGTGVIIATAWMHLMAPAVEALGNECLVPRLGEYDWAFFIGLFTVLTMFFAEILATHFGRKVAARHTVTEQVYLDAPAGDSPVSSHEQGGYPATPQAHMGHCSAAGTGHEHPDIAGQLTAIIVLEFGVIFHSVFIGLVLATTEDLVVLLIVLVFHQFMEGLGLGSRLATTSWPGRRSWLPYLFAICFAISTPIGTAAGLGAKPSSVADQMLTNGIFDAISAGILMYTGLVELLAHEFMFNPEMKKAGLPTQMLAFGSICFGAGVMALLAKWA
ncbi:zinc-regulated transporter 2 [Plectosphaerella plurivora]|uniref:Zinc-regulated transporter 2 n=1 Tax=Plectosphaerella plurivora TaxID=936078 RepID=A0A9P9ACU7_9PEZI|nr:zinc-regulated transporter 2 [Plectosphaerella plurivora]